MFAMKFGLATLCLVVLLGVSGGAKLKQKKGPKGIHVPQDVNDVKMWRLLDMVIAKEILSGTFPPEPPYFPIDSIQNVDMSTGEDKKSYIVRYNVQSVDVPIDISECFAQFDTPLNDADVNLGSINIISFICESTDEN